MLETHHQSLGLQEAFRRFQMLKHAHWRRAFRVRPWMVICNVSQIMQHHNVLKKPSQSKVLCRKKRCQSPWLSIYLSALAFLLLPRLSRRSMHDARPLPLWPLRRSHRLQHRLRAKPGSDNIARCILSSRTRLHQVPEMLVNEKT